MTALKQIFQEENLPCVYLHDNLKKLLGKFCFHAFFMCFFQLVAIRVTFNDSCC